MKISSRTIMKIARLYKLADDNTSVKQLRQLDIANEESFVRVSFILNKVAYGILFGSVIDDDYIDDFWLYLPKEREILPNPLDDSVSLTPFQGKSVIVLKFPQQKQRLDIFLSTTFDSTISRSLWQKYIKAGCVSVNGAIVTATKHEVDKTDDISVEFPERSTKNHKVVILYEDSDVVVVNKPAGLLTHAKGGLAEEMTLADMLREKTDFPDSDNRPGIVHRLDRDTSGVILVAKNAAALTHFQKQFASRQVQKTYIAIVTGQLKHDKAKINLPIIRDPLRPSTFRVGPRGKTAETTYEVVAKTDERSLLKLQPKTGRTHQLRVHMNYLGAPIVGDKVYGGIMADRMMLHAYTLEVTMLSGEKKIFKADLPSEFTKLFSKESAQL